MSRSKKNTKTPVVSDDAAAAAVPVFSSMSVADLRAACKKAGLDEKGTKPVLVARLEAGGGEATEPEPVATKGRKRKTTASAPVAPATDDDKAAVEEEQPKKKGKTSTKKAPTKKGQKAAAAEEDDDDEEEEVPQAKAPIKKATASSSSAPKKAVYKVDPACGLGGATVHENYDAMLNQTNIGSNNNKFYRIQVLKSGNNYYCWTHWGRVGENGQNGLESCGSSVANAIKAFEKKFKDKTSNAWDNRANFVKKSGKYDLLEMDNTEDPEDDARLEERLAAYNAQLSGKSPTPSRSPSPVPTKFKPSALKPEIQEFMSLLFDSGMFTQAMASYDIDTAKMPLGKLSKNQINKGFDVLSDLENAIKAGNRAQINELSGRFYGIIPHSFGRNVPPAIATLEHLKTKQDLLNILNDIEIAQTMQADQKKKSKAKAEAEMIDVESLPPNPLDEKYETLKCDLDVLPKSSKEYKIIEQYVAATKNSWNANVKIQEIFTVDRHQEDKRFAEHAKIKNRKLCWHGTNVAVVAAILNSGLRIMPHSGGRVGKGIYFASEHSKSAGYVGPANFQGKNTAIMFLAEVALGEEHSITRDDSSLKVAPKGFDSIVARGTQEPDPKKNTIIKIDGNDVVVPQAAPIPQPQYSGSSFNQSEYLIYKESQHRIRYAIKFAW